MGPAGGMSALIISSKRLMRAELQFLKNIELKPEDGRSRRALMEIRVDAARAGLNTDGHPAQAAREEDEEN